MGVTVNGERDILGIWAGDGGEGARFWLQVFSELKNRGVDDVLIAVCYAVRAVMPMMLRRPGSVVVGGLELSA
jgi:transposase-like protein